MKWLYPILIFLLIFQLNVYSQRIFQDTSTPPPLPKVIEYSFSPDSQYIEAVKAKIEFEKKHPIYLIEPSLKSNTVLFIAFIVCFFLIIFLAFSSPEYFRDMILSSISGKYLLANFHRNKFSLFFNNIFLDSIFVFNLSIIVYYFFGNWDFISYEHILISIFVFYLSQLLIIIIFYNIFYGNDPFNIHLHNILGTNRTFGIIATPLTFISIYLPNEIQAYWIKVIFAILVMVIILRFLRVLLLIKKTYSFNIIYIVLYLCVFEISPYLLLIRQIRVFINN